MASILLLSSAALADTVHSDVNYLSWCSENQVVVHTYSDEIIVVADCTSNDQVCKEQTRYQGRGIVVTAMCRPQ